MGEQRNLIIAIALSLLILIGWQFFEGRIHPAPPPQPVTAQQPAANAPATTPVAPGAAPAGATTPSANGLPATLDAALAAPRVRIETPSLNGSIALKGARIDDLMLVKYRLTTDPKSAPVTLLSPAVGDGKGAYFAQFGWFSADPAVKVPDSSSEWTASGLKLTPETPVTLTWDNGAGLIFKRVYAVDADYMFTVTESVENGTDKPVALSPYGDVAQWGTPPLLNYSVLHEGPIGVIDDRLRDKGMYGRFLGVFGPNMYKGLAEDDALPSCKAENCHGKQFSAKGGWLGFTDKYFAALLLPDPSQDLTTRMFWDNAAGYDHYQTDWSGPAQTAAPGASVTETSHLFAGAKVLALLDGYSEQLNTPKMYLAIDFGIYRFITLPLFKFLRYIHAHVANFGLAILIFTVCVRGAFFPIAQRQFRSMNKMKMLQPQVKKLQEKYADDRGKLNTEMMALYKREKANPVAGCLPLLLQIPVFFALYKVLLVTIEMRQAPFFGWVHDLSSPDPTTVFNLLGLIPWDPPMILHIGLWPILMGITMFLQQKMNPAPPDPVQARMFTVLPVVFTFMLAKFPAGLVIYWSWSNLLSIGQQWLIRRRMAAKK